MRKPCKLSACLPRLPSFLPLFPVLNRLECEMLIWRGFAPLMRCALTTGDFPVAKASAEAYKHFPPCRSSRIGSGRSRASFISCPRLAILLRPHGRLCRKGRDVARSSGTVIEFHKRGEAARWGPGGPWEFPGAAALPVPELRRSPGASPPLFRQLGRRQLGREEKNLIGPAYKAESSVAGHGLQAWDVDAWLSHPPEPNRLGTRF